MKILSETQNEEAQEEIQYKPINHFKFFEDAHTTRRTSQLNTRVKQALSTDDALLGLTDLPEETRTRLLEAYTSQDLQISMFDESLLVHRSNLEQLNGFCGGKIKQLMLNLETEQQKYVDMDYPPAIIYGTAGSGKTAVAIYRAIRLAQEGQDVLLLTFSSRLSSETRKLIISILGYLPDNLEVTTFHSAMLTLLQKIGVDVQVEEEKENGRQNIYLDLIEEAILYVREDYPTVAFLKEKTFWQVKNFVQEEIRYMIKGYNRTTWEKYKTEIRKGRKRFDPKEKEAMWRIYKAYQHRLAQSGYDDWVDVSTLVIHNIQNNHEFRHYGTIIVDETQDLTSVDIQAVKQVALASSINGKICNLLLLLDPLQKLYSQGSSWESIGIHARGRTRKLKKNFRNTRQIAEAATYLLDNNSKIDNSEEYILPELSQRHGPPPVLVKEKNFKSQIVWIKNTIKDLISDETFRLSDFAVLCRNNILCVECRKELNSSGLSAVLNAEDFNLVKDQIKVLTVHSAKGLEFPVVFIYGLVKGGFPANLGINLDDESNNQLVDIEKERTLCYVAMTRASDALYLMSVKGGESVFVKELEGKVLLW